MYIGVDLGSTNMKAALYDENMKLIERKSRPVDYFRENGFVEFDTRQYYNTLLSLIRELVHSCPHSEITQIAFTGQAESLVCVGRRGCALMNAISWMDERSIEECEQLSRLFSHSECERITGQRAILPTWPATKILWLKSHRPDIFAQTDTFMLLKDYIVFLMTGKKIADMSIATFSFYFDIYEKCYWKAMLDAIGISERHLPPLSEPCSVAGPLCAPAALATGLSQRTLVNIGTLDHFAGMIGTGNISAGGVTLSTGTVMAMSQFSHEPAPRDSHMAMHYGFLPDSHIIISTAESGGVSLEWFKRTCLPQITYPEMNAILSGRTRPGKLLFLPYLVGTNAPEFDADATSVFYGLRQEHDALDMALAVMEGVAYILRKNMEAVRSSGTSLTHILATGGGSKSPIWCQLYADITGLPVIVPAEKEAACLGAALIAATADGRFSSFQTATEGCVHTEHLCKPQPSAEYERKYRQFCALYDASIAIAKI